MPQLVRADLTGATSYYGDTIMSGYPVSIDISLQNYGSAARNIVRNGFRIYSPDGAEWQVPTVSYEPDFVDLFVLFDDTRASWDGWEQTPSDSPALPSSRMECR